MRAGCHVALWMIGACALVLPHAQAQQKSACQGAFCPDVYKARFEPNLGASANSGSRDGWESYPLSQESGYDPTIFPVTENGISRLVRESAPTRDGPCSLGFIRRTDLISGGHGHFHARVRMPYAQGARDLVLSVFRGAQEERHEVQVTAGAWHDIEFPLDNSNSLISAVALAVDFPDAHVGHTERVEIADLRIKALTKRHLTVIRPKSMWDPSRQFYYLQDSIETGHDLDLAFSESEASIRWTLLNPSGSAVAQGISSHIRYTFTVFDQIGMWKVQARSRTSSTDVLLLLRPIHPSGLIFDQPPAVSGELLRLVRKRRNELRQKAHPETGANIARMNSEFLLPGLPTYFDILLQTSELAMLDAIEYRSSGDPSSLTEARSLLRSIASWPIWVHPWFPAHGYHSYYPEGLMTRSVVVAMEFLGSELNDADRKSLDTALLEKMIRPVYEEYVLEDRLQFNTSNWIGNTVGGALLAALESRNPDAGGYALGLAIKERDHVSTAYTPDGSYGEGVTYQRFDLENTAPAAAAVKRQLGFSLDHDLPSSADSYMRAASYGAEGAIVDFGDSHVDVGPSNVLAYIAALNRSEQLADFYFEHLNTNTSQLLPRILWESQIQRPGKAPLPGPGSRLFPQRGLAVLRDGWNADANVIAMRAGPNFNHNHADQGSLFFALHGQLWISEAGYADYYKDPFYNSYNIQAIAHNTLLVDDDPESQILPGNAAFGEAPSFTHAALGERAALVQVDLTSVYRGKLKHYTRTLLWTGGGSLAVLDDVSAKALHRFTQVWHPAQPIQKSALKAQRVEFEHGADRLTMQSVTTAQSVMKIDSAPLPLKSYEESELETVSRPQIISVSAGEPSKRVAIATVFSTETLPDSTLKGGLEDGLTVLDFAGHHLEINHTGNQETTRASWSDGFAVLGTENIDDLLGGKISADSPVDVIVERDSPEHVNVSVRAGRTAHLQIDGLHSTCLSGCIQNGNTITLQEQSARFEISSIR